MVNPKSGSLATSPPIFEPLNQSPNTTPQSDGDAINLLPTLIVPGSYTATI